MGLELKEYTFEMDKFTMERFMSFLVMGREGLDAGVKLLENGEELEHLRAAVDSALAQLLIEYDQ